MCMRVAMWGWVLVLVVSLPARAQQQQAAANESDQTLKRLSIEDLSRIDVTSTLKHAEPISGSAAAIEVITGDGTDLGQTGVRYGRRLGATAASASTASIVIAAARCSRPARARRIRCARARRASASITARRGAR